jgi:hypothetical protein
MKALVFKVQVDYEIVEVKHVLMVSEKTPSMEELQKQHNIFLFNKIKSKKDFGLGKRAENKSGCKTAAYGKAVEKFMKDKKLDFISWVIKKHNAKPIKFEDAW